MQHEMTDVIDSASQLRITSEQEKELIERELVKEKKTNQEAMGILQDILVSIGVFFVF
jgi:hypothetical protein